MWAQHAQRHSCVLQLRDSREPVIKFLRFLIEFISRFWLTTIRVMGGGNNLNKTLICIWPFLHPPVSLLELHIKISCSFPSHEWLLKLEMVCVCVWRHFLVRDRKKGMCGMESSWFSACLIVLSCMEGKRQPFNTVRSKEADKTTSNLNVHMLMCNN